MLCRAVNATRCSATSLDDRIGFRLVRVLQSYSKHCVASKSPTALLETLAKSESRPVEPETLVAGSARQLRSDEVDELVAFYRGARNIRKTAEQFGLYRATVREHLRRRGVEVRQVRSMTNPEISEAVRLYEGGDSSVTVGEKLGFSNHTILKALRSMSVEVRPQPGR